MTRLLKNILVRFILLLLIFVSTNVWSVNIDTELINATNKSNFSLVKKNTGY